MYAITGITGQVGGAMARALLADKQNIRAVLRNEAKGKEWAALGCPVAIADMDDADALARAFSHVDGVFLLPPPVFDPEPGYPEARHTIDAVTSALAKARPPRVVCLSTIGADAPHDNLLTQRTMLEEAMVKLDLPVTFLRPAWFMENAAWDVIGARDGGMLHSFLQPLDKPFPMVATLDIGRLAADLIQQDWTGARIVEIEGPTRVSPNDIARAFADALGRPVQADVVARASWQDIFLAQGMKNPLPRIRMLDGFNEGWIDFAKDARDIVTGKTTLAEVVRELVDARSGAN